jgi:hypothetical protein
LNIYGIKQIVYQAKKFGIQSLFISIQFKIERIVHAWPNIAAGNTKGGSITVPLTSCLTGFDQTVLKIKTKIVSCHTADSKPVNQEVNGTVILHPLVFPDCSYLS